MTDKRIIWLRDPATRQRALDAIREAPDGWKVTVQPPTRSLDQNAAQWPILEAFAKQLQWPVNGQLCWMNAEEWKDVLSAAFYSKHVRLAAGIDGGVVMLGQRTSNFSKAVFSDWLTFLHATAIDRGVTVDE